MLLTLPGRAVLRVPFLFSPLAAALTASLLVPAGPCTAQLSSGATLEAPRVGPLVMLVESNSSKMVPRGRTLYTGDTYSFEHQLGANFGGIFDCFSPHLSGMDDNTVLFDGLSELLDPYLDGTAPFVFEFETTDGTSVTEVNINSFGSPDLFPEGFEDPGTGTPLTDACVEIGIDDTLDPSSSTTVSNATLEFIGTPFGTFDITNFFSDPWDGRLSIVFTDFADNFDITEVRLTMEIPPPTEIFADGFESGDASAWSDTVP